MESEEVVEYIGYTAVLPDNKLMIVGGQTEQGVTDTVEIVSLIV